MMMSELAHSILGGYMLHATDRDTGVGEFCCSLYECF